MPNVIVISGANGAGKSTLAPFLLRDTFGIVEYVNADTIAQGLSALDVTREVCKTFSVCINRWQIHGKFMMFRLLSRK